MGGIAWQRILIAVGLMVPILAGGPTRADDLDLPAIGPFFEATFAEDVVESHWSEEATPGLRRVVPTHWVLGTYRPPPPGFRGPWWPAERLASTEVDGYLTTKVHSHRLVPVAGELGRWHVPLDALLPGASIDAPQLRRSWFPWASGTQLWYLPTPVPARYLLASTEGVSIVDILGQEVARLTEYLARQKDVFDGGPDPCRSFVALQEIDSREWSRLSVWDLGGSLLYRDAEWKRRHLRSMLFFDEGRQVLVWENHEGNESTVVRLVDLASQSSTSLGERVITGWPSVNPRRTHLLLTQSASGPESDEGRFQLVRPRSATDVTIVLDQCRPGVVVGGAISPSGARLAIPIRQSTSWRCLLVLDEAGNPRLRTTVEKNAVSVTFVDETTLVSGLNGAPVNRGRNLCASRVYAYDLSGH